MRYFLELSYKGTAYSGFQVQQRTRTVQSELERAMGILFRQSIALTGSSRTDAGVHAKQNYFHFDTELEKGANHVYNLNALLPPDIAVRGIYQVPADAHARFDATAREYKYLIYRYKNPFLNDRGWQYPYPLNKELLDQAAAILPGYNDFTSFSKRNTQVKTYICTLERSDWELGEGSLVYTVRANRFLRGMVRGLVGTMLRVGRGQLGLDGLRAVILAKDCSKADFSTPPQGLTLEKVSYPVDLQAYLQPQQGSANSQLP
jgi:tRNA pseudouridine38-40 synthase